MGFGRSRPTSRFSAHPNPIDNPMGCVLQKLFPFENGPNGYSLGLLVTIVEGGLVKNSGCVGWR